MILSHNVSYIFSLLLISQTDILQISFYEADIFHALKALVLLFMNLNICKWLVLDVL